MIEFLLPIFETHLALAGGLLIAFSYLFQIHKMYTLKTADGVSIFFFSILTLGLTCLLLNAITIFVLYGSWGYMFAEILNVGLAITVLSMVVHYNRKNND